MNDEPPAPTAAPPDSPQDVAATFWSATGRAHTVIVLMLISLALSVAGVVTSLNTLALLRRVQRGDQVSEAEAERVDMWSSLAGIPGLVIAVALAVIYLMWVYRAHLNLELFTADTLNFSSGWAVGWWFIPFANLVQPARVMGEIWRRSDPRHGAAWSTNGAPALLVIWWFAFLIGGVVGRVATRMSFRAEKLPDIIGAAQVLLATEIWDFVAIPLAIAVVVAIKRAQQRRLDELGLNR